MRPFVGAAQGLTSCESEGNREEIAREQRLRIHLWKLDNVPQLTYSNSKCHFNVSK